ncbi:hypothetical protein BDR04DRAFT_1118827 [Suillus decipiens]|nr:hypothetical protein BDR04DRAFT_1118827 [Suillus decipiens]
MSSDENSHSQGDPSHKTSSNPLVLHGQHFGQTVFALCNYPSLLTAGILRLEELQDSPIEDYPADVQREHKVFIELIDSYPDLIDCLTKGKEEDVIHLGKGTSGARGDDTKTLKSAVLDWIVPRGQAVILPLSHNIKSDRGFNHEATGALLCPTGLDWSNPETKQNLKSGELAVQGDQWPIFLYAESHYNVEDPWKGLLKSDILIFGFKHVFTSLSSVDKEPKATRSGNAYLHSMKSVWFALSSSSVFSCTDTVTDSENFYHSILDLLDDPDETEEVTDLLMWWTRCVFPNSSSSQHCISKDSALSKIRARHAALQELVAVSN